MKRMKCMLIGGLLAVLFAGNVLAQDARMSSSDLRQPASVHQVAYDYANYYADDDASKSPSDAPPPAAVEPSGCADDCGACGTCDPVGCGRRDRS